MMRAMRAVARPVLRMTANKNIRTDLLKTQATENVTVIVGAPSSCLSPGIFRVPY
jgi:hypothetical protein